MTAIRLDAAASLVAGRLCNADAGSLVTGMSVLACADANQLAFLANPKYAKEFEGSNAAAVLLAEDAFPETNRPVIRVKDPYLAFALLQRHFHPEPVATGERDASASIHPSAVLAEDVEVGAMAVVAADVRIGAGTIIGAGCVVGEGTELGRMCRLHPRVIVAPDCVIGDRVAIQSGAVIGSDGFGYAWSGKEHLKIPQVGRVVLEEDVEIGANACIDRGAIGDTVICRGVKIDNLVQVGHNARVGAYTVIAAQTAVAGSTEIGAGCQVGGQVAFAGHLKIGNGCKFAGQSGVIGDIPDGEVYAGTPAVPHRQWLKNAAMLGRLPEIWNEIRRRTKAEKERE